MAKRTTRTAPEPPNPSFPEFGSPTRPMTTGRRLFVMAKDQTGPGIKALDNLAGLKVAASSDFASRASATSQADVLLERLGIAVVKPDPDQEARLMAAAADESNPHILAMEPELMCYASGSIPVDLEYLRGWRDATAALYERLEGGKPALAEAEALDEAQFTWGLQRCGVDTTLFSGFGINVAVLDTGFDLQHPDFVGRTIESKSFVMGQTVDDGHGHGTHCIGTACGPQSPGGSRPRYGIAHGASIFVGKVLSNSGSGPDGGILEGIDWAMVNGCAVVSMSLGAQGPLSVAYETAGQRALDAGTLILAAAGNDSGRPGTIMPVGRPANSVSILAIAAIDEALNIASFSNGGTPDGGGQIDLAGPGVRVLSAAPRQTALVSKSGTSMATPHMAGLAALYAQASPTARGLALKSLLLQSAQRLSLPSTDVGSGLGKAPLR